MSLMWKGPCDELKASYADPLAGRLHRRASRFGLTYNVAHDGRSAEVSRFERRQGGYSISPLGIVEGGDPTSVILNVALQHTPFDAELFAAMSDSVLRRAEDVADRLDDIKKRVGEQIDDIAETMAHVRT